MRTLRALGYNAIDVYFPWNYHEIEPGKWDFSGERDVEAFLKQAKEAGLWVVARPGPYICSEWDGGALPAYLNTRPGMRLRDCDHEYLEAVRGWYDQIMPVLALYQLGRQGTVILVQLENELDFYNTSDRGRMMTALRDMALLHGLSVPLMACTGQGDIQGAVGGVDGIFPACNVYFDPRDPKVEARVRHYEQIVRQMGYPLCITETNRTHAELRRLIAGGAKLVGPYLQVGGTDFGFSTSINNWGDPLSFVTSHYDFGGMISPGGKVRPDGQEAVIMTKMLAAMGSKLALSTPQASSPVMVKGIEAQTLALAGGGYLVGLPNIGELVIQVIFGEDASKFPVHTELKVAPNACPFVLLDYPLSQSGIAGQITYATAELVEYLDRDEVLELTFAVDAAAELMLEWPGSALGESQGWRIEQAQTGWRMWTDASLPAEIEIREKDGKRLVLKAFNRAEVGDLRKTGLNESLIVSPSLKNQEFDLPRIRWHSTLIDPCGKEWFNEGKSCRPGKLNLEENNIFRGFGWYRSACVSSDDVLGFLIRSGSDVLSLYLGAHFMGTLVPGGGDAFIPLPRCADFSAGRELVLRAEIWGHSNFDDHRLPALCLNSMRGMSGLVVVHGMENLTTNWFYQHKAQVPAYPNDPGWPLVSFGAWSTTDEPSRGVYYQEIQRMQGMDTCILHFPGMQASAQVYIDRQPAGSVNPFNPYIDISELLQKGETARIEVAVEQDFRRPAGQVFLYQGKTIQDWDLAGWDEAGLARLAQESSITGIPVHFPMKLAGGEMAWLHAELPLSMEWERGFNLELSGRGVKASVMIGKRLVGRVWLPSEMRPRMTCGADDRISLPAGWLREAGGNLHLLLECVSPGGELQSIKFVLDS
jgi:beta-galactosidase